MKPAVSVVLLGVIALGVSGCGNAMQSYLERGTPTQTAAVRQDLTMPPDLRLPAPGSAPAAADPGLAPSAPTPSTASTTAPAAPAASSGAATDVYTQAGIDLYKPDGTKKTDIELRQELQAVYLARKQQKNPKYGTIFNIGNIFSDE
ncbi:hypothetical protein [Aestuariivirga sp.]|uniref:hypothetical protein n=1 Tax=Aestuariivirga sp. TaxID=2650926 RepID=UPI003594658B